MAREEFRYIEGKKTAVQRFGFTFLPKIFFYDPRIDVQSLALYITLRSRMWDDKNSCFPSMKTIVKESGLSKSTAILRLNKLIDLGFIRKEQRKRDSGDHDSNVYTLVPLDDLYCPPDNPMEISKQSEEMFRDGEMGYLLDRIFDGDENAEDTSKEPKSEIETRAEEERRKRTEALLGSSDEVKEKSSKARANRKRNKKLKEKKKKLVDHDLPTVFDEKPKELNVNDVEAAWRAAEKDKWPTSSTAGKAWNLRDKGIAKNLIKEYGAQDVIDLVKDVIGNWEDYQERYELGGYPSMRLVSGWSQSWMMERDRGEKDPRVSAVEEWWRKKEKEAWPESQTAGKEWSNEEREIVGDLLMQYDFGLLCELITDVMKNWSTYVDRHKLQGYPNVKRIAHWAESWLNELDRGPISSLSNREKGIAEGEYDGERKEDAEFATFGE